jgi:hypothetical protein
MSGTHRLFLIGRNRKPTLLFAVLCSCASPCLGFTLPPPQKQAANTAIERMVASDYDGAIAVCDSLIRFDPADPLGWMLRLSAIGLHDLDLDSVTDSLDFPGAFKKTGDALFAYERNHGVSSYSLTVKGFAGAIAAAYTIWRKKYFAGLDLGLDALAKLREAKRLDNTNCDVDLFLGLYTYARADFKKTFWWAFFLYSGDKEAGIRSIRACSRNAQFCRLVATLLLGEVAFREKRTGESDSITAGLLRAYPGSRLVQWTCAKRGESIHSYGEAAESYRILADAYDSIPRAKRNALFTRTKAAHSYFSAGSFEQARLACRSVIAWKKGPCDDFCRQLCRDAERLLGKLPAEK